MFLLAEMFPLLHPSYSDIRKSTREGSAAKPVLPSNLFVDADSENSRTLPQFPSV